MEIFLKSDGEYVKQEMTKSDFIEWFKSNSDEEGNVTGDCMLCKDGDITINTDKSMTWTMSDFTLDRDFERIDPAGWDLKMYKKNPVMLWAHQRSRPAIGTMSKVRVKDEKLIGDPVFDEEDEFAVQIKGKVERGIIKSGSVGFYPAKVEIIEDDDDKTKLIYRKQELREFSLCNVPANPNAIVQDPNKSEDNNHLDEKINNIMDDIGEMKIDIENLKGMQIELSEKIEHKQTPMESLFAKKKPHPQGLKPFFEYR